jgi:hypothetical protein
MREEIRNSAVDCGRQEHSRAPEDANRSRVGGMGGKRAEKVSMCVWEYVCAHLGVRESSGKAHTEHGVRGGGDKR